jgi:hypothetical protein
VAYVSLWVSILLLVCARFNGVSGVVLPFLQQAANPALYPADDYVRHSLVPHATLIFVALKHWQIDLTNPAFLIVSYLFVSAVAGLAVWRILERTFDVDDRLLRTALLFALIFADFKLIQFNKSSWLSEHNFSLTFVAGALRLWFLALLLERRVAAAAAILIPINLLSFKVGWPLIGFLVVSLGCMRVGSVAAWGLLVASLIAPGYSALHNPVGTASEPGYVYEVWNQCYPEEDNPFSGTPVQALLFLGGTFLAWRSLPTLRADLRVPIASILAGSFLIWLAGGLYLTYLGSLLPLPVVVLLSPARALELPGLLVYLLLLLWLLRSSALADVERFLLAMALMVLKVTESNTWVNLSIAIATVAVALLGCRLLALRTNRSLAFLNTRMPLPMGLAFVAPIIGLFFALNVSGQRATYRVDPVLGIREVNLPEDAARLLKMIASRPGDQRLVAMWPQKGDGLMNWNYLARKSGVAGDLYYVASPDQIRVLRYRNDFLLDFVKRLQSGKIDAETTRRFESLDASLLIPASYIPALAGWEVVADGDNWKEVRPPSHRSGAVKLQVSMPGGDSSPLRDRGGISVRGSAPVMLRAAGNQADDHR